MPDNKIPELQLDPWMPLLILGAGLPTDDIRSVETLLQGEVDWVQLEALSVKHQVFPLLYKGLEQFDKTLVPHEVWQHFTALFKGNALRNFRLVRELLRVISLFDGEGIGLLPFKGPVLTLQSYGDLSLRSFADLDILVHSRDFVSIVDLLLGNGFWANFPTSRGMGRFINLSRRDFRFSNPVAALDFHHRLTQGPSFMDLGERFRRESGSLELMDQVITAPAVEHSLLTACIHGTKDQWRTLRTIVDVALLLTANPRLDWSMLIADATKAGCVTMLRVGLELARQLGGVELPGDVLVGGSQGLKVERLARGYLKNLVSTKSGGDKLSQVISMSKSLDTSFKRLHYLSYFTFTPTPVDWEVITLPSPLYFLYYLIRPFRLFFSLAKQLVLLFFKRKSHIGRQ